jgi:hypothetical protein
MMRDQERYKGWLIQFVGGQTEGRWDDSVEISIPYGPYTYSVRLHPRDGPFDTEEQARSKALVRAKDWIERDGQLRLSKIDPAHLLFRFRIGDHVSTADGTSEGVIREGYYKGESTGRGSYSIIYEVVKRDGLFFKARQHELRKKTEEGQRSVVGSLTSWFRDVTRH